MNKDLRIGDNEREAAIAALGEHFAAGRIDKEEYDERSGTAWTARTAGDLKPLFVDLPHSTRDSGVTSAAAGEATSRSSGALRSRPRWAVLPTMPVIILLVALAMADVIPWFVAVIVAWVWCYAKARTAWHHSGLRHWRYQRHHWNHSGRT